MITGNGLVLRVPGAGDVTRSLELYHDHDQLSFGMPVGVTVPRTADDLDERMAQARTAYDALEPCELTVAALEDPDRFLGSISWRRGVAPFLRVVDVGYAVHPDARGKGVAGRALRTFTQWLTADESGPRQARVQLDHSVENPASCRTALAAGFEQEGVRRSYLPLRDDAAPGGARRHDVCLHGFVPEVVLPPR
ncbi:GNAT family N-acetyltransferase [Nocardioides korecus]